jgi:hypothetical protein
VDKTLKAKWVKALESGKYRRAHAQLKTGNAYCCLGVLCDVAGIDFNPEGVYLPEAFRRKAGIGAETQRLLALANDGDLGSDEAFAQGLPRYREGAGASFNALAKYVRDNL